MQLLVLDLLEEGWTVALEVVAGEVRLETLGVFFPCMRLITTGAS